MTRHPDRHSPDHDSEFDGFDDVIDLLRDGPLATAETPVPASLWAGIADAVGIDDSASRAAGNELAAEAATTDAPSITHATTHTTTSTTDGSNVVSLSEARARRAWGRPAAWLTAAAAAVVLIGVPVGLALQDSDPDRELVASVDLEWLADEPGSGASAALVRFDDDLQLELLTGASAGDGEFLELWLLDTDDAGVADLISLGRVSGSGSYDVPDDLDLDRFDVVDVSIELDDGNPDHSGNSILRSTPFTT